MGDLYVAMGGLKVFMLFDLRSRVQLPLLNSCTAADVGWLILARGERRKEKKESKRKEGLRFRRLKQSLILDLSHKKAIVPPTMRTKISLSSPLCLLQLRQLEPTTYNTATLPAPASSRTTATETHTTYLDVDKGPTR
eukprot:scaffold43099_cov75-Cyclotella_meneghiniana.AAC.3